MTNVVELNPKARQEAEFAEHKQNYEAISEAMEGLMTDPRTTETETDKITRNIHIWLTMREYRHLIED